MFESFTLQYSVKCQVISGTVVSCLTFLRPKLSMHDKHLSFTKIQASIASLNLNMLQLPI